eukprot:CAMPEP_0174370358 /NCGR_PEP_ID=MMETSP0811_2-20130205/95854_1 /TAXON_ID=73025 ORGANISM="Eutreptiella gymnastica-like, Strain CCMP1594" /NCGR_SAMPLE_ID=MMETSP0811_2 /ASSEMBLY_ACC=CAM_ASM_000667 /LENGTH=43 /DNA_ID= /DNA_START= /DNA_END= /DNA_ORIENTATION=
MTCAWLTPKDPSPPKGIKQNTAHVVSDISTAFKQHPQQQMIFA